MNSIREKAYLEAMEKLKNRRSFADSLTQEQIELLNNPDICWDIGHTQSAELGKRNERDS